MNATRFAGCEVQRTDEDIGVGGSHVKKFGRETFSKMTSSPAGRTCFPCSISICCQFLHIGSHRFKVVGGPMHSIKSIIRQPRGMEEKSSEGRNMRNRLATSISKGNEREEKEEKEKEEEKKSHRNSWRRPLGKK